MNIQRQKVIESSEGKIVKAPILFLILKKITQPISIAILLAILIPFYYILSLFIYLIFGFVCGGLSSDINRYFYAAFLIIIGLFMVFLLLLDVIQNFSLLKQCKLKEYFITNDPYQYRTEFITVPLFPIVIFIWIFPVRYPSIIKMIFAELAYVIGMWIVCVHPLLLSIIFLFKKEKKDDRVTLETIFSNIELYNSFLEFSKYEWSMENVHFQKTLLTYKSSSPEKQKEMVEFIENNFLLSSSPFELNISDNTKENIRKKIFSNSKLVNYKYKNDFFDEVEKEVKNNLNDIFMRFKFSSYYKAYLLKLDMLDIEKKLRRFSNVPKSEKFVW